VTTKMTKDKVQFVLDM